jgi:hypothetical protein
VASKGLFGYSKVEEQRLERWLMMNRNEEDINRELDYLGKSMKRLVGIKEICVSFTGNRDITEQELHKIMGGLKRLKGLEVLTVKFPA